MYIVYNKETLICTHWNTKKPVAVSENLEIGYIETLPEIFDGLKVTNVEQTESGNICTVEAIINDKKAIQSQISVLKTKLAETDYKAIKYAEGLISEEDYAETKALRQSWRDEINTLEASLK